MELGTSSIQIHKREEKETSLANWWAGTFTSLTQWWKEIEMKNSATSAISSTSRPKALRGGSLF